MTDSNVIDLWGGSGVPEMDLEKAEEAARERFRDETFDFERGIRDQIASLRDICEGDNLPFRHGDEVLLVPFHLFVDALDRKLRSGMAALRIEDNPEVGKVAQVITFKSSIKPKKPKSTLETIRAMPVRLELSPEEREERRVKREEMKAERQHQREKQLAFLRSEYGEDQAQAYAALMGWR